MKTYPDEDWLKAVSICNGKPLSFLNLDLKISSYGRLVKCSGDYTKLIKPCIDSQGYELNYLKADDGKYYTVGRHRLTYFSFCGTDRDGIVDHKSNVKSENHLANLRLTDRSGNARNRKSVEGASSKYLGVSKLQGGKWNVNIRALGKNWYLGRFTNEKDAAAVYNLAVLAIDPEHANPNPVAIEPRHLEMLKNRVLKCKDKRLAQLPAIRKLLGIKIDEI